ncbi:hypothetical protein [Pyxidicoccus xibeiensis]|uniref:hypothetical protein n=1 Tax=Pyxidicoccus xibeiensis TaxID=2906759 RepID=UPI0020A7DB1E|nr:hypothetical protein [Pyxidicoccus xibeiensis]MCP3143736.1 hypothetical protein [Pyxidicoccus xibeiensis]
MYLPLWVLVGVPLLLVAFRGRLSITWHLHRARSLWPRLTRFGKRRSLERFLRAKGYTGSTLADADVERWLASPEAVERCFLEYTTGALGRFFPETPVWAAVFAQVLSEALRDGLSVEAVEAARSERDRG